MLPLSKTFGLGEFYRGILIYTEINENQMWVMTKYVELSIIPIGIHKNSKSFLAKRMREGK